MKSFLFVMQTAAYCGSKIQETLDQVLITGAFDQEVSLLLLDEAVFHLKKNQQSQLISSKDIGAIFRSLEIYDIQRVYVDQFSLVQHGLTQDKLIIPVTLLNRKDIAATLKSFDYILSA